MDNKPWDDFKRVCIEVEAPGPSLDCVNKAGAVDGSTEGRPQPRDCQC